MAKIENFRFWCQKVLPLVYDDSLSYYELLCKVVDYLNNVIGAVNENTEDVASMRTELTEFEGSINTEVDEFKSYVNGRVDVLESFINNYFDNLDVQTEINNKLNEMASDGSLDALILPYFNEYKSEIDGDIDELQSDMNVLTQRVDNIASLPEGSTTGDAELIDIRVGANGVTYNSAGTAVRTQFNIAENTLKTQLNNVYGVDVISMTKGGYIRTATSPVDVTAVVPDTTGYAYAVVDCSAGDVFTINATGGAAARAWCFIDEDGTILAFGRASTRYTNRVIKAPAGSAKLIINDNTASFSYAGYSKDSIARIRKYLNDVSEGGKIITAGSESCYFGATNIVYGNYLQSKFFNITRGKSYRVVFINGNIRRIGMFDADYHDDSPTHNYASYEIGTNYVDIDVTDNYPILGVYFSTNQDTSDADCYLIEKPSVSDNSQIISKINMLMTDNYNIRYANAINPLNLVNYLGNTMNVHPKVLYFPNGLFGHKYWMAYTPYPNKSTYRENPCVAFSEDGFEWINIDANPLDVPRSGGEHNYNSDTHLVYNSNTGKLEVWYRWANEDTMQEIIYRKTSSDGVTWSEREELKTSSGSLVNYLSPSVEYDSVNSKYLIWVVNWNDGCVKYYESVDGDNWSFVRDIVLTFEYDNRTYDIWHADVTLLGNRYVMIAMCREHGISGFDNAILFMSQSTDNIDYRTPIVEIVGQAGKWDASIYRSCIVDVNGTKRIYYSALNGDVYQMGITESETLSKFIGSIY